jgi:hypothetical protein
MNNKLSSVLNLGTLLSSPAIPTKSAGEQKPRKMIIPKGCKQYFFNQEGDFITLAGIMPPEYIVFQCYALNDGNAIRKFKNRHKS